jgi:hexosaminidase
MKKIFKVIRYSLFAIFGLILVSVIFLYFYYSILENREVRKYKETGSAMQNIFPSVDKSDVSKSGTFLNLIPVPREVQFTGGFFQIPSAIAYSVVDSLQKQVGDHLEMIPYVKAIYSTTGGNIIFRIKKELPVQGYTMDIRPGKITVEYSDLQGLYYALVSLKVLNQNYNGTVPCVIIEDYPDLSVRGVMLDISRDKIPKLETLKDIVKLLADLKYNHFELYTEGFSFAYPSFKNLWEGKETPVTGEEIKELDAFCRDRFIDLVPNQNSFGHMAAWLATDQFKDLSECPKGYKLFGLINSNATLDPVDPQSIKLISKMTDDLLPNFSSANFNVNLDEPIELGKGKSKKLCERLGVGKVYLDYALKIHEIANSNNKSMLMWGDIVLRHPDLLPDVPEDVTILDWGYEESYPFERNCRTISSAGHSFMVCPGTSSWTSITGRTDNMIGNIENAVLSAVKYGARGMLLTDWGDMGHWQYLPVSYAGYTVGAALSWNCKSRNNLPLAAFLSSYVFRDKTLIMGDLALNLGRYNRFEEIPVPNMTTTMLALQFGLRDEIMINAIYGKISAGIIALMGDIAPEMVTAYEEKNTNRHPFDYKGMYEFLNSNEKLLSQVEIQSSDSLLLRDEYRNALKLIRTGVNLQDYIHNRRNFSLAEEKSELLAIQAGLQNYLAENQRLWLARNKPGGYQRSTAALNNLLQQIEKKLNLLEKSFFSRGLNRIFEKIVTAGMVLYLKLAS